MEDFDGFKLKVPAAMTLLIAYVLALFLGECEESYPGCPQMQSAIR